jgi:hypothetical protein
MKLRIIDSKEASKDTILLFLPSEFFPFFELDRNFPDLPDIQFVIAGEYPDSGLEVEEYVDAVAEWISEKGIRWLYCVGIDDGSLFAQAIAIRHSRLVRRMLLVNPRTRRTESNSGMLLDKLESYIPCGLPLRVKDDDFDSRADIHRVHTPTLVLCSESPGSYGSGQAEFLSERLPNAWKGRMDFSDSADCSVILEQILKEAISFRDVPVKSPQKNR